MFVGLLGIIVKLVSCFPLLQRRWSKPRVDKQEFSITHAQKTSTDQEMTYAVILTEVDDWNVCDIIQLHDGHAKSFFFCDHWIVLLVGYNFVFLAYWDFAAYFLRTEMTKIVAKVLWTDARSPFVLGTNIKKSDRDIYTYC